MEKDYIKIAEAIRLLEESNCDFVLSYLNKENSFSVSYFGSNKSLEDSLCAAISALLDDYEEFDPISLEVFLEKLDATIGC